ncbi:hypothetical protein ACMD2_25137, partial [Ananas comosus]
YQAPSAGAPTTFPVEKILSYKRSGSKTFFWLSPWIGRALMDQFLALFFFFAHKFALVSMELIDNLISLLLFFVNSTSDSTSITVWYSFAPPRVLFFMWLLHKDRILTLDNLRRRGWILTSRCELCLNAGEDIIHLFPQCSYFIIGHLTYLRIIERLETQFSAVLLGPSGLSEIVVSSTALALFPSPPLAVFAS